MIFAPVACASHATPLDGSIAPLIASSAAPIHSPLLEHDSLVGCTSERGGLRVTRGERGDNILAGTLGEADGLISKSMSIPRMLFPGRGPSIAALRGVTPSILAVSGIRTGDSFGRSSRTDSGPDSFASTNSSRLRSRANPGIIGTSIRARLHASLRWL